MTPTLIVAAVAMFIGASSVLSDDTSTKPESVAFGVGVFLTAFALTLVEVLTNG